MITLHVNERQAAILMASLQDDQTRLITSLKHDDLNFMAAAMKEQMLIDLGDLLTSIAQQQAEPYGPSADTEQPLQMLHPSQLDVLSVPALVDYRNSLNSLANAVQVRIHRLNGVEPRPAQPVQETVAEGLLRALQGGAAQLFPESETERISAPGGGSQPQP